MVDYQCYVSLGELKEEAFDVEGIIFGNVVLVSQSVVFDCVFGHGILGEEVAIVDIGQQGFDFLVDVNGDGLYVFDHDIVGIVDDLNLGDLLVLDVVYVLAILDDRCQAANLICRLLDLSGCVMLSVVGRSRRRCGSGFGFDFSFGIYYILYDILIGIDELIGCITSYTAEDCTASRESCTASISTRAFA